MNAAQIHLALNHAPLFFSVISFIILGLGYFRKNDSFIRLALYGMVLAGLLTLPVFFTGEGTEELVEKAAGVQETVIEAHEEMATIAFIVILGAGAVALLSLFIRVKSNARFLIPLALVLSLVSFSLMGYTAHLGGLIRHTELQATVSGANGQEQNGNTDNEKGKEKDADEDDD